MKFFKKTLILLCSALALALAVAIAACGGGGEYKLSFETFGGTNIKSIKADAGEDISDRLPDDPTRDGFVFGGWYLEENCTGEAQTLPTVMPEGDVTYYAKWTAGGVASLTLDPGKGGVLNSTKVNVAVGANLLEVLATCDRPTPYEGLTFAGWYRGNTPIGEEDVMPAFGLTLTAKYTATYTIEVYRESVDGVPVKDETPVTGSAFYGEPFSCADVLTPPEHFTLSAGAGGVIKTDSLGVSDTFTAYFLRKRFYITYLPNAPQGVQADGDTPMQSVPYGAQAALAPCGYTLGGTSRWRCAGWAEDPQGSTFYGVGERVEVTDNMTLFAVWEKGYTDVFGGQDVLYPAYAEPTVIRLVREGMEDKTGAYDAATGLFSFKEGSAAMLDGRLLAGTEEFFYFRDTLEGEYNDLDGTSATLAMNAGGAVVYTDKEGAAHTGKYSIDPDTGYFFFDDNAGETGDFFYNLFTLIDGNGVVFRRQSTEELGYYYDEEAGVVLYLDGLGGLRYYYNDKNFEYQDFFGDPIYVAYGYYEWMEGAQLFLAYTRDISVTLKQFTFSRTAKTGVTAKEEYPDVPSDAALKGTVDLDDGLRGSYIAKREDSENELYLDGYGRGTFGEKEGAYELFTWLYSYEEENGEVTDDYFLVRFTPDDGSEIVYFRLDTVYGDYEFDRVFTPEETAKYADYDFGRYEFTDLFLFNVTFDGFIMIFENGDAEVWTQYGITTQGNIVYVLYVDLVSHVQKEGDTYTFQQTQTDAGVDYGNEFRFTLDNEKHTMSVVLPAEHDTAQIKPELFLDYTARKATYKGRDVDYWYTIGHVDFYTFEISDTEELNYWVTSGGRTDFHAVSDTDIYDLYVLPGEEDLYYSRLIFTGNNEQVFLAFMLESGMYRVIGEGRVEKLGNGDRHFTLTGHISDFGEAELREGGYDAFDFRVAEDDHTFRKKSAQTDYTNFTTEGYGTFVFTDAANVAHSGMIVESIGEGESRLIYFMETRTTAIFLLAVDESNPNRLISVTADAGYWYEMNDNQLISPYKCLILNGQGTAFYYEIENLTGEVLPVVKGTYTRSVRYEGPYSAEPFPEYTVTLNGETANYLLATYLVYDNTVGEAVQLSLYQKQIAHRVGEFYVRGGGWIESVGYPGVLATYTDALGNVHEGNMYIGEASGGIHDHTFNNDVTGTHVRFWEYVNGNPTSTEYIFEIVSDELVPLTLPYGDYALSAPGGVRENTVLHLDGRGAATFRIGNTNPARGTYSAIPGTEEYRFTSATRSFRFRISRVTEDDEYIYLFEEYDEGAALTLYNEAEWSLLLLDGYGGAVYINRYGDHIIGSYGLFSAGMGAFESENYNFVFSYAEGGYEAVDHSEYVATYYAENFASVIFTATRVILNGEEYFYTVQEGTVSLFDVVKGTAAERATVPLPTGNDYTYNSVVYHLYEGGELTFTDSEFNDEEPIELVFTPDGAAFTVSATFGGYEGYTVTVAYEGGTARVTLGYRARTMDALPEEYALTLHYAAGENTFTVTPEGGKGTYKQVGEANNTIELDNRRVGAYSVALHDENAGDTLIILFNAIKDSAGQPLAFRGSAEIMGEESVQYFGQDHSKVATIEGTDGISYTLRFFLDENAHTFTLRSVVIEKMFNIEGVGEVTFVQLWAAGSEYGEFGQKDLVSVSMRETGVETNIYSGELGEGKAALVRQSLHSTTGSYDYEAYVFDLTYDANGFVSAAVKEGDYSYAEALQGIEFKIRFLFTGSGDTFEVAYILTFSVNDRSTSATFAKNADGSWTITTADKVYKATATQNAAGAITLTVTEQQ